ncbi:MAG: hypothetical protein PHF00_03885 [Elusimicrobia bacterium]|nr:hypothetical protein [Elusimicrobiota bacterium]
MRLSWRQVIPALLIGLLAGTGLCRARVWRLRHHGPTEERILAKFDRELKLDASQRDAVLAVLKAHREKLAALHQETKARFEAARAAMDADIEGILKPEQRERFAAMKKRWTRRMGGPPRESHD